MFDSLWSAIAQAVVPLASAVVGGLIAIVQNVVTERLAERRRREADHQDRSRHDAAILTGAFAIRNFIAEQLNAFGDGDSTGLDLQSLRAAQDSLQRLIDKAAPNSQLLMIALFEVQVRLADFIGGLDHSPEPLSNQFRLIRKGNALLAALHTLDTHLHGSLDFVNLDDFEELTELEAEGHEERAA